MTENDRPKKSNLPFRLDNFIKEKILKMNKRRKSSNRKDRNLEEKRKSVSQLLPHDSHEL